MEIAIDYDDGRIREFNTGTYVPGGTLGTVPGEKGARNFLTEFDLRLDNLETKGLRLDVYFNCFGSGDEQTVDMGQEIFGKESHRSYRVPVAKRYLRGVIMIATPAELEGACLIVARRCQESVTVAWRQGSQGWLVDGQAFARMARQVYTDAKVTSTNAQLLTMVRYAAHANPTLDLSEVVPLTGVPYDAYIEVEGQEALNRRPATECAREADGEEG